MNHFMKNSIVGRIDRMLYDMKNTWIDSGISDFRGRQICGFILSEGRTDSGDLGKLQGQSGSRPF